MFNSFEDNTIFSVDINLESFEERVVTQKIKHRNNLHA